MWSCFGLTYRVLEIVENSGKVLNDYTISSANDRKENINESRKQTILSFFGWIGNTHYHTKFYHKCGQFCRCIYAGLCGTDAIVGGIFGESVSISSLRILFWNLFWSGYAGVSILGQERYQFHTGRYGNRY